MKKTATALVLLALLTGCGKKPKPYTDEPPPAAPVAREEARKAEPSDWAAAAVAALTEAKEATKKATPKPTETKPEAKKPTLPALPPKSDPDADLKKNAKDAQVFAKALKSIPPAPSDMKNKGYTIEKYEFNPRFDMLFEWAIITFEPVYLTDPVTGKLPKRREPCSLQTPPTFAEAKPLTG